MDKTNLLIPACGLASRFKATGIYTPKLLIPVGHQRIIDWSFDSIEVDNFNLIFVIRDDECLQYDLDKKLIEKFGDITIVKVKKNTQGAVESCLYAEEYINNNIPLSIFTLDVSFSPKFTGKINSDYDGLILTFSSSSPNYSYSKVNIDGDILMVKEKDVISNNASAGIYSFRSGELFVKYAKQYLNATGELHIAPLYNLLIYNKLKIGIQPVDKIYIMGTPEEANFIESLTFNPKRVGIVSDHSGFENKQNFRSILDKYNFEIHDFGCYNEELCDYSDLIPRSCEALQNKEVDYVFGFCRSGQGVNIHANKFKGVRAALIYDKYTAEYSVRHNAANFFSIPEKSEDKQILLDIILNNTFDGGRHQMRVMKVDND